ncbi:unnamed protein product [Fraxinus pennsylvanica]|uniref:Uncharacterized protein n=1 Tax=Fraxinus pennsylvanica TaxID=56036 RepID=A0AAD1YXM5_9LAMI|nr:unnamed protein product [Fraxinus pennsylvanica]
MRISAPNEPLKDDNMKKYFQSAVMAFGKLLCMAGEGYLKALSTLNVFVDVNLCVVMWDLELDALHAELFQKDLRWTPTPKRAAKSSYSLCMIHTKSDQLSITPLLRSGQPIFTIVVFCTMFRSSSPLPRKSERSVQLQHQ